MYTCNEFTKPYTEYVEYVKEHPNFYKKCAWNYNAKNVIECRIVNQEAKVDVDVNGKDGSKTINDIDNKGTYTTPSVSD